MTMSLDFCPELMHMQVQGYDTKLHAECGPTSRGLRMLRCRARWYRNEMHICC